MNKKPSIFSVCTCLGALMCCQAAVGQVQDLGEFCSVAVGQLPTNPGQPIVVHTSKIRVSVLAIGANRFAIFGRVSSGSNLTAAVNANVVGTAALQSDGTVQGSFMGPVSLTNNDNLTAFFIVNPSNLAGVYADTRMSPPIFIPLAPAQCTSDF
jgi:hypothetical protein